MYFGYDARKDSPLFQRTPNLAAGASVAYQFEGSNSANEPAAKYAPFNYMAIQNNSTNDVIITLGNGKVYLCKGGLTVVVEKQDIQAMRSFRVTNNGAGAINAVAGLPDVVISFQRHGVGTVELASALAQKFGKFIGV